MHGKLMFAALSMTTAGLLTWLEKYIFGDWEYLTFLAILIVGDTILGFYWALKSKTITASAWGQIIEKLLTYFSLLIVCHILAEFTIAGRPVSLFTFAKYLGYSVLIVKESISILEHLARINKRLVPAWLLQKLKRFEKTGKTDDS
jgi:toxin secretion/phage lysis holin